MLWNKFILFKISNFSCLFILLDFISTLSFSIYININQIKKQIKNGNGNTNSLISSTLLSGPFLFIFSLLFYEKNKEKNPYLTFRCFASISSSFLPRFSSFFGRTVKSKTEKIINNCLEQKTSLSLFIRLTEKSISSQYCD